MSSPPAYRAPAFADFKREHTVPGPTPERLAHLAEHGFVIIDDFADSSWIARLREAGRRVAGASSRFGRAHASACDAGPRRAPPTRSTPRGFAK